MLWRCVQSMPCDGLAGWLGVFCHSVARFQTSFMGKFLEDSHQQAGCLPMVTFVMSMHIIILAQTICCGVISNLAA